MIALFKLNSLLLTWQLPFSEINRNCTLEPKDQRWSYCIRGQEGAGDMSGQAGIGVAMMSLLGIYFKGMGALK